MNPQRFNLKRKRLADQIADQLMEMITEGSLKPGDKLPSEPELMQQFQVGRSSIREAIGALSLIGLISVRPGHGTHVAHFTSEQQAKPIGLIGIGKERIRELVEARIELECVIVRLAAKRANTNDLVNIRKKHQQLRDALNKKSEPMKHDLAFHMALAQACHNTVLTRFFLEMRQPIQQWMEQKAKYDWGYDQVYEQHDTIFTAIEAHDKAAAEEALKAHLLSTGEQLVTAILSTDE